MKVRFAMMGLVILLVAGAGGLLAQSKRQRAVKEFMRDKLELSQKALEGLATEDYDLIIAKATKLSAMTLEPHWRAFENPDYDQHSVTFRRQVDALAKAARNKNLDGATLAYVRMTISCVDCHKFVRGKIVASAKRAPAPQTAEWKATTPEALETNR
jgi:cytochrome c556